MGKILEQIYEVLNSPDIARIKRIKKIVALYKYRFKWSRKTFMSKVFEWLPELRDSVPERAQKFHSTQALFAAMEIGHMNLILTRLEKIEMANRNRGRK